MPQVLEQSLFLFKIVEKPFMCGRFPSSIYYVFCDPISKLKKEQHISLENSIEFL